MNWYKISQQIIEMDEHQGDLPSYSRIGHFKDDAGDVMWIWKNGELLTEETSASSAHWDTWRDPNSPVHKFYRGRYDGRSGNVSIAVPYTRLFQHRALPDRLIRSLTEKFGEEIKIHVYR